jgi:hypothetical protein
MTSSAGRPASPAVDKPTTIDRRIYRSCRVGSAWRAAAACNKSPLGAAGLSGVSPRGYVDAVKVRPREATDRAAARTFLARHHSIRVARLGELVNPLDHPALVADPAGGQLAGMLTYVPGQDWRQCEILTPHAGEQRRGAGTALIEAVPASWQGGMGAPGCGSLPLTTTLMRCASTSAAASAW